jgi:thiamine-phosphate pyrophosphorylase
MPRRQRVPRQWLVVAERADVRALGRLPRGSEILLLERLPAADLRQLRLRGVTVMEERRRSAVRVHDIRELRRAMLARTPMVLLSPIFPTSSHPDWKPIPPMRAAALARLAGRKLIALGGMDARKFARVERLGFQGWAGISAWKASRA